MQFTAIHNYVYGQYSRCAAKRQIPFHLSIVKFFEIAFAPCVYCGAVDSNFARRARATGDLTLAYNGVDRRDSDQPYTDENCVSCCKFCNAAKSARNEVEFLASEWLKNRISSVKGN